MNDNEIGLIEDEKCNRDGCVGIMQRVDTDGCCSCHINPPCSYCTDAEFICDTCEFLVEVEQLDYDTKPQAPLKYKTPDEKYKELDKNKFNYITIAGAYYFMEYKGYCPDMTRDEVEEKFNTCFGRKWLYFGDNKFHLKVYTD